MQQLKNTTLKVSFDDGKTIPYRVEEGETPDRFELKNNEVLYASCKEKVSANYIMFGYSE